MLFVDNNHFLSSFSRVGQEKGNEMEKELATINTEEIDHSAINELDAASKVSSYVLHVSMN